jgi:putative ABC transport system permease protein
MGGLLGDLRFSVRMLLRNPGFTAVALLSLALGIGANTTIFSVFNTIVFRPFPVEDPDRLALLLERNQEQQRTRTPNHLILLELKKQSQVFEDWTITSWGGSSVTLSALDKAERGKIGEVGPNFFSVVGVLPALGRSFGPEFLPRGESEAAVISHGCWQRFFGGSPDVLGQTITVEGFRKTIVGVMPAGFWLFPWAQDTDVWLAYDRSVKPKQRWVRHIGRLKPGVTLEQARVEMEVISSRLEELDPASNRGWSIEVVPLREWADGGSLETLYLLMAAVALILLIACANVANLLLARATSRQKEISVRTALGADQLSILRQLLTESLVLALLGGALGILLSFIGIRIFFLMAPPWLFDVGEFSIDLTVLGFTFGISLLAGTLFGIFPALRASKPDLHEALKEGGRSSRSMGGRSRNTLVVTEVALALVLLAGAGLMTNSFLRLRNLESGFRTQNLLVVEVFLAGTKYWDYAEKDLKRVTSQGLPFFEQVLERIRALPGVVSACTAGNAPPGWAWPANIEIVGQEPQAEENKLRASYCEISPEFFETLEIPLLKGRYLSVRDVESSPWVVVINETMAKQFFPNDEPIGKFLRLTMPGWSYEGEVDGGRLREIVGVVGDVKRWSVRRGQRPLMYTSHAQHVWEFPGGQYSSHLRKDLVIRTATNPMSLARDVQRIVAEVDRCFFRQVLLIGRSSKTLPRLICNPI